MQPNQSAIADGIYRQGLTQGRQWALFGSHTDEPERFVNAVQFNGNEEVSVIQSVSAVRIVRALRAASGAKGKADLAAMVGGLEPERLSGFWAGAFEVVCEDSACLTDA